MTENTLEHRWQRVQTTWRSNAWLFGVFGFILGLLAFPAAEFIYADVAELLWGLVPETFGIIFTVLIIDRLYRNREEQRRVAELQRRLLREASATSNDAARQAVDEMRDLGWLTGDGSLLQNAYMRRANLSGVNFGEANLSGAMLRDADLRQTDLRKAQAHHANLIAANLTKANMGGINLQHANLRDANCQDALMYGAANLRYATLIGIDLRRTNLRGAKLDNADLRFARLQDTDLLGASMVGVNLTDASLAGASFKDVLFADSSRVPTILPDGTHWTPQTDMSRFTDPSHPDFWKPDWVTDTKAV